MTKKKEVSEIAFQLEKMELTGVKLDVPQGYIASGNFDFDITVESRLESEQHEIVVTVNIVVNDAERKGLGGLISRYWYSVRDFDTLVLRNKEGKFSVPQALESSINAVSISTARGMMFSAFRGTALHEVVLPVLDIV